MGTRVVVRDLDEDEEFAYTLVGPGERGVGKINVVNRTLDRAQALRERFGSAVHPANWTALPHLLTRAGLLVNTTSLGWHDNETIGVFSSPRPPGGRVSLPRHRPRRRSRSRSPERRRRRP